MTLNGCLTTLFYDRYQEIEIKTEPSGAFVYDESGMNIGVTPIQIPLKRSAVQRLTILKKGYQNTEVVMEKSINKKTLPLFFLPLLVYPDIIPYNLYDVYSGSVFTKEKTSHDLILQPVKATSFSDGPAN